jgi:hypothetical protein
MLALADVAPLWFITHPYIGRRSYAVPNMALHHCGSGDPRIVFMVGTVAGSSLFGLLHCIAWNYFFRTAIERLLWRFATLTTRTIPPVLVLPRFVMGFITSEGKRSRNDKTTKLGGFLLESNTLRGRLASLRLLLLGVIYTLARLYVIVEIFRTFFYLPQDAFQTTIWISLLSYYWIVSRLENIWVSEVWNRYYFWEFRWQAMLMPRWRYRYTRDWCTQLAATS